ncbi:MAG: 2-succinyl-5-enolpyruvyl-6-hydroxy-3-cyclohexene-1-carboxylic-acid synthase, partial [Bacteroidales bacterium]|nr:2-succinyl-5-enolpyruvyl-6-hydroxy-3-cyclohexene-1-carboxylic-acid synthase [Bacteroidales bacterium]
TIVEPKPEEKIFADDELNPFIEVWNKADKKLLIAGLMNPNPELTELLSELSSDPSVVLLSETTSNLSGCSCCPCVDNVVSTIDPDEAVDFRPDMLVTFGGHIISKMIKTFLRENKPAVHWHIDLADTQMNTFTSLTAGIKSTPGNFLRQLIPYIKHTNYDFKQTWYSRNERSERRHKNFLKKAAFSDIKVFEMILNNIPDNSYLQLGNSTPVRYAQLFKSNRNLIYHSNRGTSGIDGTLSTAAGAAWATNALTTLITGDLGFFYDSNGLLNNYLSNNLRIVIINNSGGGIFRFIQGPDTTNHLETFFEVKHNWNAEFFAKTAGIKYLYACNPENLQKNLEDLYSLNETCILEIKTPAEKNARMLKSYFKYLSE